MSEYQIFDMELIHIDDVVDIEDKSFKTPWSKDAFVSEIERNKCARYRVLIVDAGGNSSSIDRQIESSGAVFHDKANINIDNNSNSNVKVVAYGGLWHVVDEGHITNIAVHPDYRGLGFGSAILKDMISCAKEMNIVALTLEVRTGNSTAINLYSKYGFKEVAIRKNYYADTGEDAIIMWKNDIQY